MSNLQGLHAAPGAADIERALSILRGTSGNMLQSTISFVGSVALCVYGSFYVEMDVAAQRFFGLAVFFMVAQGFTLAKTIRDRFLADVLSDVPDFQVAVTALRGHLMWFVQVVASFVVAVLFSFYTLITQVTFQSNDFSGDAGFSLIASSFALVATLSFAKTVRDQADADTLSQMNIEPRQKYAKILQVSEGSVGYLIVCAGGLLLATVSTVGGAFAMPDLEIERKGFILIAAIFTMTSAFHLAKLIRDDADPVLSRQSYFMFRLFVWVSFALALVLSFGGVAYMPMKAGQKRFVLNGFFFILSATISTAKMVRDRQEVAKMRRPAVQGQHQD